MRRWGILLLSCSLLGACSRGEELGVINCFGEYVCTQDGTIVRWMNSDITFAFEATAPENLKTAMVESAADYNGYLEFNELKIDKTNLSAPPFDPNYSQLNQDGVNGIYYVTGTWPWAEKIKNSLAVTLTRYNAFGIIEADIFIKADAKRYQDPGSDLYQPWAIYIATHELGHALGRSHSKEVKSFMYPVIRESEVINTASDNSFKDFFSLYDLDIFSLAYDLIAYPRDDETDTPDDPVEIASGDSGVIVSE